MRPSWLLSLLFLPACATPTAHFVATADDSVCEVDAVADALATADVVAFGELHQTPPVHRLHHELLASLHARRPNLVIAMEFFERDVQGVLLKYLSGMIDEPTFLAGSRPPRDYDRDYRPVIEFAKVNGLVVLAANAPRKLAAKVATEGASAVAGDPNVARETTAPEDDYWDAFVDAMKEHPGSTEKMMKNFYAAQCLKDDTMAESITDHLQERRRAGDRPLVVLICGNMHSNYGRGTVARIKSRMPDLDVRVLSAETVKDLSRGVYTSPKSIGEYVVLSPEVERPAQAMPAPKPAAPPVAAAPKAAAPKAEPAQPAPAPSQPVADTSGLRPALGLMPDYENSVDGVAVGSVREGGPAEKAGLAAGDLIVMLAGTKVGDVEQYMEVLEAQAIGKTVTVRVKRAGAEVDLQVQIGSRSR